MAELDDINKSGDLAEIKLGGTEAGDSVATQAYVASVVTGASGTFTSQDGKTITVTNGLVTDIT